MKKKNVSTVWFIRTEQTRKLTDKKDKYVSPFLFSLTQPFHLTSVNISLVLAAGPPSVQLNEHKGLTVPGAGTPGIPAILDRPWLSGLGVGQGMGLVLTGAASLNLLECAECLRHT